MCKKLIYIYLVSFVLVLSLAGTAQAIDEVENTWTNGTGNRLWNDAGNWSLGHVPTYDDSEATGITIIPGPVVEAAGMGSDGILMQGTSDLTIDGGELLISGNLDIATGTGSVATVTVNSGTLEVDSLVQVGRNGEGTLNMNGGALIAGKVMVGVYFGCTGHVNLDGGVITAGAFSMREYGSFGTMDITGGTMIIDGDIVSNIQIYINLGWITAYDDDGTGTLQLDYDVTNTGKTTLRATGEGFNPIPADGSTVPVTLNQLQWTLPEPILPEGVVTCDVYFSTIPEVYPEDRIVDNQAVESVSVTLANDTTYYWAIVLYDSGSSTPHVPYLWSPVFTFTATTGNLPPDANAGNDVPTWLVDGERVVQLDGDVNDPTVGPGPDTVEWRVIDEPNELNPAVFSDPFVLDPTVTVKEIGSYTLQLEADDGEYTDTDTMQITVYADSCEHARNQEGFELLAGDINHDCKVDFLDFANFAATWLQENYSTE